MSSLRVRPQAASGVVIDITPQSAGWTYVGFKMLRLSADQVYDAAGDDRETCVVVLSGQARLAAGNVDFGTIGGRSSVFEDAAPGAAYVAVGDAVHIEAVTASEIALCTAPGSKDYVSRVIPTGDMSREVRGQGSNTRHVRNILPEDRPAHSLLVVEVVTPGGNWSSYPPHKHDTARDSETRLEETYYHRLNPPQGFAFQRVYTDDRSLDETVCVEDGDVVMVPKGYHPVGAPHGYDLYYLNVMAGPERRWMFHNDPQHEWMLRKG
ncbi:5-deoxy-glucuronate isomerase [Asticcacaulis sp. 201]|uniref:5-deoxy-glucuronate isomerase n=1 Tax=Asticcacaulis sp. 201 TaxID=3028787 RepID=UPI002916AD1F|nr:5-deoxy-glucuronate isomerase [Asticcacaulis sp. 201]MDV6331213.1 5-deoxy-glucuronate isomerase [Asticcacaulis sp. 201]